MMEQLLYSLHLASGKGRVHATAFRQAKCCLLQSPGQFRRRFLTLSLHDILVIARVLGGARQCPFAYWSLKRIAVLQVYGCDRAIR